MQIGKEKVVSIDYTLRNDAGDVVDTSEGRGPLVYLHGAGNIIPGLERQLEGRAVGDSLRAEIAPADAYGERDAGMVQSVPRTSFGNIPDIQPGMQFQARSPAGTMVVTVAKVEGDEVTIDANHPLAGQTLHFDVDVREVRAATPDELAHGHVHGPGGHAH